MADSPSTTITSHIAKTDIITSIPIPSNVEA